MGISSTGLGSGLDVTSIISQLTAIEKQPLTALQTKASSIQTQISTYSQIQSQLSSFSDAAGKLTSSSTWTGKTATSSDTSLIGVKVSGIPSPSQFSMQVTQLAQAQSVASAGIAKNAALGSGTLTLEVGEWADTAFTPDEDSKAVSISVDANDTVSDIASKINDTNSGLVAMVLNSGGNEKLLIRSKNSGEAAGFRIQVQDDDGVNDDAAGLSQLAYDPGNPTWSTTPFGMARTQVAQDAKATINGVEVTSATNQLTEAIPGLTIDLIKVSNATVDIKVENDQSTVNKALGDLVASYNSVMKTLTDVTKYDADTKTRGVLQGDASTVNLQNVLRNLMGSITGASTSFTRLSDVGVEIQRGGLLSLNSSKLSKAMENTAELKNFFSNKSGDAANNGFGWKIKSMAEKLLAFDGAVANKTNALKTAAQNNQSDQSRINERVANYEKRLKAQYSSLDSKMSSLSALNSYVTKQFSSNSK